MNMDFSQDCNGGEVSGTGSPMDYAVTLPKATTQSMPSMTATAQAQGLQIGSSPQPGLMPSDLLKPLPSIVHTDPAVLEPDCDPISKWVEENTLLAALGLAAIGMFLLNKRGGE